MKIAGDFAKKGFGGEVVVLSEVNSLSGCQFHQSFSGFVVELGVSGARATEINLRQNVLNAHFEQDAGLIYQTQGCSLALRWYR